MKGCSDLVLRVEDKKMFPTALGFDHNFIAIHYAKFSGEDRFGLFCENR